MVDGTKAFLKSYEILFILEYRTFFFRPRGVVFGLLGGLKGVWCVWGLFRVPWNKANNLCGLKQAVGSKHFHCYCYCYFYCGYCTKQLASFWDSQEGQPVERFGWSLSSASPSLLLLLLLCGLQQAVSKFLRKPRRAASRELRLVQPSSSGSSVQPRRSHHTLFVLSFKRQLQRAVFDPSSSPTWQ